MAIKYFPNRVFKKNSNPIDRIIQRNILNTSSGSKDITSSPLDVYVSADTDWKVQSIKLNFSTNTVSKNYSVEIDSGMKVVQNLNDSLWFKVNGVLWQQIILDPGFYNGTNLALELQTKLNANTAFIAASKTFTVSYSDTTGQFTVTLLSSGTLNYIQTNNKQPLPIRDSTGGHLLGFTQDTVSASNVIASDTNVFGLNTSAWIMNETNSTAFSHYNDEEHVLSIDQALHIKTNTAALVTTYEVRYQENQYE